MIVVDHGIAQRIVLVAELQHRALELGSLRQPQALGKGTRGDVADDDLQRHDGNALDNGLAVGDLLDQVGGNAVLLQHLHQVVADLVVDDALGFDGALFQAVERGRIVLVVDDQQFGVVGFKDLLGLAFVELVQFFDLHSASTSFCKFSFFAMTSSVIFCLK